MNATNLPEGRRARLRARFSSDPMALSDAELLELLLTYAIRRQDVRPLAEALLQRFGSLEGVLAATATALQELPGIGDTSALLIRVVGTLTQLPSPRQPPGPPPGQPALFAIETDSGPLFAENASAHTPAMRTYANDEVANALHFIPQAVQFTDLEVFKAYLEANLPYNSDSTRKRRANYIIERFFPAGRLNTPLAYYAAHCEEKDLKPALFYHVCQAEPLVAKIADALIWPALPRGYVDREALRAFVLQQLPDIGLSSQQNVLRSVFYTYSVLGIARDDDTALRFSTHNATLPAFLYVLVTEFPETGTYTFEQLEQGPLRRRLLWDREWLRRQLYNLRDIGIVSKVSEIDTLRQFTLAYTAPEALRRFFAHSDPTTLALRERSEGGAL